MAQASRNLACAVLSPERPASVRVFSKKTANGIEKQKKGVFEHA